jgi:hypothetical protein
VPTKRVAPRTPFPEDEPGQARGRAHRRSQVELNGLVLRYRPWNDDPNKALLELMMYVPIAEGAQMPPPPAPVQWLEPDQSYSTVPQFGPFGLVMDQDVNNMARVQRGMRAADKSGVTLGNYQESMIRWHHHMLDRYMADK